MHGYHRLRVILEMQRRDILRGLSQPKTWICTVASKELTATILRYQLDAMLRILHLELWALHSNLTVYLYFAGDVGFASRNLLFWRVPAMALLSDFNYGGSEHRTGS